MNAPIIYLYIQSLSLELIHTGQAEGSVRHLILGYIFYRREKEMIINANEMSRKG